MALTVFNPGLELGRTCFRDYQWTDAPDVYVFERKGPGLQTGVTLSPHMLRRWAWSMGMDETVRAEWQAFFGALGWIRAPFLLRDPRDKPRKVTLEPGVGDAARTVFSLPTAIGDADYPFYALSDGTAYGLVATAPRAVTLDVDARTVTFAAAPGAAAAVELVYQPLRLAALAAPADVQSIAQVFVTTSLDLQQRLRP